MINIPSQPLVFDPTKAPPSDAASDAVKARIPYVVPRELSDAVNLALYLRRPLLLEGEAGAGKSTLAAKVAYHLGLPLFTWNVRSTSRAEEGLYTYDAIRRLHDNQLASTGRALPAGRDPADPLSYVTYGALGKAFMRKDVPAVVLIDEIDKAELDFPNDLLTVLDQPWRFEIPEADHTVQADSDRLPIVFITSNKEKGNLPAPFLRRCIYAYVPFPSDPAQLAEIVKAHEDIKADKDFVDAATARFLDIRNTGNLSKLPGTSEFLDWVKAANLPGRPVSGVEISGVPVPNPQVLFKLRSDYLQFASGTP